MGPPRSVFARRERRKAANLESLLARDSARTGAGALVGAAAEDARQIAALRPDRFCVIWRSVHANPFRNIAAPSGWVWLDKSVRHPPVRAPINMTDQNRASASSVPHRLFDPVL
ncbi:hypothetical protein HDG40_002501 [Paraburkholderia sp. JPY158]|uniref:Uncharacterized protein n=1 Tax=Paraburkholderia atlantica TaxID=2654982 RepID=A0A7W8Q736_PARAM|nr:hypothetical protein [Paraburkholderia atlantica]MBB5415953.1 hypothetical protein [Paraburkholderia atlantica]MBB5424356.1 hypothetical protein [Paraburkholderia atlantica]